MTNDKKCDVYVGEIREYDVKKITAALRAAFEATGIDLLRYAGKKVVIKPNLVMKKSPDGAATTHPAVIDALLTLTDEAGISAVIAESPGGVYSAQRLESIYRVCGMTAAAGGHDCTLNTDVSFKKMTFEGGRATKAFDIITPIAEADVVIDVCKLKSHSLTKMSAALKNFFGTVPGIEKFELHAAHPEVSDFTAMLCDLAQMIVKEKETVCITDGIVGMEGEGPTGGTPREIGALIVSRDPFMSDAVSADILGFGEGSVPLLAEALRRGLLPPRENITVGGDGTNALRVSGFVLPRSQNISTLKFFSEGALGKIFMPRPKITKSCRACGECAAACPQKTIRIENGRARIDRKRCIRCYCCQELCPFTAIKTHRNPIIYAISKIGT